MILDFVDTIENWLKPVKEWISKDNNTFFLIIIFVVALAVFLIAYKVLNKDN